MRTEEKQDYMKKYNSEYRKTPNGIIRRSYSRMKEKSKINGWDLNFNIAELIEWSNKNGFLEYFKLYQLNNFNSDFKPSFDRIDDYKPYTFDNIQILTWKQNWEKGIRSKKNVEAYKKTLTSFTGLNKKKIVCNETKKEYDSIRECAKDIKGRSSKICAVLKGYRKHHLNLTFSYIESVKEVENPSYV